ncbi:MAG: hypothetical protein ACXU7D_09230 [Burkholderiaceae bacterium]
MKIFRQILPVLLAFLLLVSQQMGYAHTVSHLSDGSRHSQQNKQLPIEQVCDQCLAFAQIGSALTSHAFLVFADAAPSPVSLSHTAPILVPRTVCAFHSRAPPVLA